MGETRGNGEYRKAGRRKCLRIEKKGMGKDMDLKGGGALSKRRRDWGKRGGNRRRAKVGKGGKAKGVRV